MHKANLNLLPTLKVLLETRNISRAAELLHLSQPLHQQAADPAAQRVWRRAAGAGGAALAADPRAEALAVQLADSPVPWSGSTRRREFVPSAASGCSGSLPPTTWPSTSCPISARP